ncbi:MAG: phosphoribosylanthranilate isomerase [Phycisphaerales bacterium]
MRTRIKICGVRSDEIARAAADAGADAVGFVFIPASPRHIPPAEAWEIIGTLPPFLASVGVFLNASLDTFSDIEETCPTTYSQLQGSENERLVRECGPGVIKAIRADPAALEAELGRWAAIDEVDALLVDAPAVHDWPVLAALLETVSKPIILGGLGPDTVAGAVRAIRPYAVDASASLEREPGEKDPALIEAFCRAVRHADAG